MTAFKAGLRRGLWHDPERQSWRGESVRPLSYALFYPAPADTPETPLLVPPRNAVFNIGTAALDAPLASDLKRYPVVLMSHGTGGSALAMGWLGCRLARAGFIALGIDHHGNTALEPYLPEGFLCWWERARDLSVALDALARGQEFEGRIDLSRVYAAGFSLGGYTVVALAGARTDYQQFLHWMRAQPGAPNGPREFPDLGDHVAKLNRDSAVFRASWERAGGSFADPRIKAVAAYAPAPTVRGFTADSMREISLPLAIMCGRADTEAPFVACSQWLHDHVPGSTLTDLGSNVGHYVFLAEATELGEQRERSICVDAPGVSRRAVHDQAAALALQLFGSTEH